MNPARVVWRLSIPEILDLASFGLDDADTDELGNIYIADGANGRVYKFAPNSVLLNIFDMPRSGNCCSNLAVLPDSAFAVSDPDSGAVRLYDPWGAPSGEIWAPGVLNVCSGDNRLYVFSRAEGMERIDCYDPAGDLLDVLQVPGGTQADAGLVNIDSDSEGNVYASCGMPPYRVWRVRADSPKTVILEREVDHPEDAILIADIAVDDSGTLWALLAYKEHGLQVLDRFAPDGAYLGSAGAARTENMYGAICSAGEGDLYLLDTEEGELVRVSA
ncbi:MAG: NHL repeat-containing protein [Armatimonadota bacterium]